MIFFVQGHSIVTAESLQRPLRHCSSFFVNGLHHIACVRDVCENVFAFSFHLKGFRMPFGLVHVANAFIRLRINHPYPTILPIPPSSSPNPTYTRLEASS